MGASFLYSSSANLFVRRKHMEYRRTLARTPVRKAVQRRLESTWPMGYVLWYARLASSQRRSEATPAKSLQALGAVRGPPRARAFVDLRPTCSSAAAWRSWTPAGCLRVLAVGSRSSVAMTSGSWRGAPPPSRVVVRSRRVAGQPLTFESLSQSSSECPRTQDLLAPTTVTGCVGHLGYHHDKARCNTGLG